MKRYVSYLLMAATLVSLLALSSSYLRVGNAGDRDAGNRTAVSNAMDSAADIFQVGKLYNVSVLDAGDKVVIGCTVLETRGNWVACSAKLRNSEGDMLTKNLWLNANNVSVVRQD